MSAGLLVTFLGIPLLAAGLMGCRAFGVVERARARALLGVEIGEPAAGARRAAASCRGSAGSSRAGSSWRHLLYAFLHMPWAIFTFAVVGAAVDDRLAAVLVPAVAVGVPGLHRQGGIQLYGDDHHQRLPGLAVRDRR